MFLSGDKVLCAIVFILWQWSTPVRAEERLYYNYLYDGKAVGYSWSSYQFNNSENLYYKKKFKFLRLGEKDSAEDLSAVLTREYFLRSAYIATEEQGQSSFLIINASPQQITLQGPNSVSTLPGDNFYLHMEDFLRFLVQRTLQKGKSYHSLLLSTDRKRLIKMTARYLSSRQTIRNGEKITAFHFKITNPELRNFWTDSWVGKSGELLEYRLGKISLLQVPEETALEIRERRGAIRAPVIFDISAIQRMYLTIRGLSPKAIYNSSYQQAKNGKVILRNTVIATQMPTAKQMAKYKKYLEPDDEIPSAIPQIIHYARKARYGARELPQIAQNIARWVEQNIRVHRTQQGQDLRIMLGPQDIEAVATATLCRASKIPARVVRGIVYHPGSFRFASWCEVYLGRWIPVFAGKVGGGARFCRIAAKDLAKKGPISIKLHTIVHKKRKIMLSQGQECVNIVGNAIEDHLLGVAFNRPADWIVLPKDIWSDFVALRSLQGKGPAILLKIFPETRPLPELIESLRSRLPLGGDSLQILWSEQRTFNGIRGIESALRTNNTSIVYRAFVGQKDGKGVLVFLLAPEEELKRVEKNFLEFIASLRFL